MFGSVGHDGSAPTGSKNYINRGIERECTGGAGSKEIMEGAEQADAVEPRSRENRNYNRVAVLVCTVKQFSRPNTLIAKDIVRSGTEIIQFRLETFPI